MKDRFKENPEAIQPEEWELAITDLSRSGPGVAREPSGRVVFVPGTLGGDRVRVRAAKVEKRFIEGEVLEWLEKSPERVGPRCPVFGKCGGCQWQHVPYERQWRTKVSGALHALDRVGMTEGASVPREEFPAREPWGYRNRLQLRGDGRNFGFFAAGTHQIVSIDRCDIARPELNEALSALRDEAFRRAKESKVEVEVLGDGRVEVAWNSRHASRGFRQVHDAQNESLKAWILERASGGGVLFDLYGGSGNLSLQLADRFHSVHCVDLGAGRLVAGSSSQIPKHFLFHSIDVQKWCEKVLKKPGFLLDSSAGGLAILDPPREGCGRALGAIHELLVRAGVKELIAVGCDADSWARDLARLRERGWVLERLAFFDFFPQTIHFESVARLVRV